MCTWKRNINNYCTDDNRTHKKKKEPSWLLVAPGSCQTVPRLTCVCLQYRWSPSPIKMQASKIFQNCCRLDSFIRRLITSESLKPRALKSLKGKSSNKTVQYYVDHCRVRVSGGNGGDGCIGFSHTFAKEFAGPDGGDGGNGAHVVFQATQSVKNLNHCPPVINAEHGEKGYTKDCHGKTASHTVLPVPIGTIIKDETFKVVGDLQIEGTLFVAARGGAGGRGNKFFVTDVQQAPEIAEYGAKGESKVYNLELRSMAHIGLIGYPNAGKSTLLRALTRARPKVAPYPFTTLRPHVGMIPYEDYEQVAVADLPGLIPGSHENRGLGIQFLQHAERCAGLLYIIDASAEEPWTQYEILNYELSQFNPKLARDNNYIILNKIDLPEAQENLPMLKEIFKDHKVIPISAKVGTNLSTLLKVIREIYDQRLESSKTEDE